MRCRSPWICVPARPVSPRCGHPTERPGRCCRKPRHTDLDTATRRSRDRPRRSVRWMGDIILVHGTTQSAAGFHGAVEALGRRGHRAIAVDVPSATAATSKDYARILAAQQAERKLSLADLVVAETVHVLESFYEAPQAPVRGRWPRPTGPSTGSGPSSGSSRTDPGPDRSRDHRSSTPPHRWLAPVPVLLNVSPGSRPRRRGPRRSLACGPRPAGRVAPRARLPRRSRRSPG